MFAGIFFRIVLNALSVGVFLSPQSDQIMFYPFSACDIIASL